MPRQEALGFETGEKSAKLTQDGIETTFALGFTKDWENGRTPR